MEDVAVTSSCCLAKSVGVSALSTYYKMCAATYPWKMLVQCELKELVGTTGFWILLVEGNLVLDFFFFS